MDLLQQAQIKLATLCDAHQLDKNSCVTVRVLTPDEAIGANADKDFVIKKGKERVIEACWNGICGQAFTDQPHDWQGRLDQLLAMDLDSADQRAVFTAGLNAVLRGIEQADGTIHCKDDEPAQCGEEFTLQLHRRFGVKRFGMIGLQPAILDAMVEGFGSVRTRVVDLNADNIGHKRCDVMVWDGEKDLDKLIEWCEVGVATGSTVVNGSIDQLREKFEEAGKPLVFFGNTISGVASLMNLERICPFAH
ncbi:hypothetical protein Pcar_0232 [Syntrophotalea carbinolica DSM 2380]|uniref:Putative heavy-metal chelation domain-containing protein n=1 Tax=Syntrophotalea carbinolica (strain DSM 2380 / NBRC 103641 / GraBd1) TaxID=338963 RepID=Q3A7Z9_SYNC1|nr:DUF364 domain-containing protein [Syntrophotalea carbinolica]ABA87493.1 hypothetical protein Pcar_0232 [Syntrophotalea carbinolica DSM 2380]